MRKFFLIFVLTLSVMMCGVGCWKKSKPKPEPKLIDVTIAEAVMGDITTQVEHIAQVRPYEKVDLVARVSGYLVKRHFVEGKFVKKGDLLYEIEDAIYKAEVDAKTGALKQTEAEYENAKVELERNEKLVKQDAVSRSRYDKLFYDKERLSGEMVTRKGELATAETNLSYCKIYAPFTGMVGFTQYNEGNYVTLSSGPLATLNNLLQVRVGFNVSETDLLKVRIAANTKDTKLNDTVSMFKERYIVEIVFQPSGEVYQLEGVVAFIDNKVDPSTGTFQMECIFDNPQVILFPGMFVKVRIRDRKPLNTLVIPKIAVSEVQAGQQVIVVDSANVTDLRLIKTGETDGPLVEVTSGLKAGDRVVVEGQIRASRRGLKVNPTLQDTLSQSKKTR